MPLTVRVLCLSFRSLSTLKFGSVLMLYIVWFITVVITQSGGDILPSVAFARCLVYESGDKFISVLWAFMPVIVCLYGSAVISFVFGHSV